MTGSSAGLGWPCIRPEPAISRVYAPRDTDLDTVVRVASTRGGVASCCAADKDAVGLGAYEVRRATAGTGT